MEAYMYVLILYPNSLAQIAMTHFIIILFPIYLSLNY